MKVAVIGATGLVGTEMLKVLAERNFPLTQLIPVASEKSVGKLIKFKGAEYPVVSMETAISLRPEIALFSAGGTTSLKYAPLFKEAGTTVIDNSSAWRMNPDHKLVVPEVNASSLAIDDKIIANPNCSTIQMVVALKPLHDKFVVKRLVVSTYQSVTGTGVKAVDQMMNERAGKTDGEMAYPYQIDMNVIPQIDVFTENGYTKEEMKMINETRKILGAKDMRITATTVRIPVMGGHSESINVEFENEFEMEDIYTSLRLMPGVVVVDDTENLRYPMPMDAHGKDEVFVGRIRRDESMPNSINMWVVADNLRKGAATNAVQIAEYLVQNEMV